MKKKEPIDINLLYIEDEEIIRTAIEKFLKRKVREVHIAKDGEDALIQFKKHSPDIVVSDIKMPKMSGLDLARKIKNTNKEIPIIFTTAHIDHDIMIEAIEIGIDKYITKPIDLITLESSIKKFAENLHLERNLNEQSRDLTKQTQLLKEYKLAIDASAIVSKTDKKGLISYVNDEFCKISQYSREELIGKSHNIVRSPDMKSEVFKKLWEVILNKKCWRGVIKNSAKDGSAYYTDTTITPILNSNEEIEEFISIRYDITQSELNKKRREKSIILSKSKLFETGKQRELIFQKKIDNLKMYIEQKNKQIKILETKSNILEMRNSKLKEKLKNN